jgi:hypothetical protein
MAIIIDDTTISIMWNVVTGIGTAITIIVGYLYKKGYIDIWLSKLFTPSEVITAVKKQNGNALTKLNMSDDIVKYLQVLAPGHDGTIDEEKAIECLHDCIRWNNRIINKIKKD